jgi:hypothetical protein
MRLSTMGHFMPALTEFTPSVIEKLQYYVYLLSDPHSKRVFYVGKGTGNRIFAHLRAAIVRPDQTDKLETIRALQREGFAPEHRILRHGLSEKEALEVEAAVIDYIGLDELTNAVHGHHADARGMMTIAEVITRYDAPEVTIHAPVILITVNRLYAHGMTEEQLYTITRGNWVLRASRLAQIKYAFCVYHGIVRQVYRVLGWHPAQARRAEQKHQERWRFDGEIAVEMQHYVGGSVAQYITAGAQNPIRYVNRK